eukprot:comp17571_c1_seq2/m.17185 comp17571_c1_seq2/g.17185  ORF comp17571_c1_seq2/g.17185 comp17571_c1_seq2/m.17185 type:complete len:169 (-) comp17571_c1_seq2:297-803(-)
MDGKHADGHHKATMQVQRRRSSFLEDIDLPSWELELASQAAATYALADEDSDLGRVVKHSLAVMEEALDRYTGEKMSISFNGGKDCTVMLHLWAAASYRRYRGLPCKLHTLYILDPDTFEEIDLFVNECIKRENGRVYSLRQGLAPGDACAPYTPLVLFPNMGISAPS